MKFDREVSIVGDVRDLHERICPVGAAVELPERPEAADRREIRREFYTLLAIVADKAVDTFLEDTEEFPVGLESRVNPEGKVVKDEDEIGPLDPALLRDSLYPYELLHDSLSTTGARVRYLRERPSYEVKYRPLLERVDQIGPEVSLTEASRKEYGNDYYAESQIKPGLATAFQLMPKICEAIETVVQDRAGGTANAADVALVARRSESVATKLAAVGFVEVGYVHERLLNGGQHDINPNWFLNRALEWFALEESRDGLRVVPTEELLAVIPTGIFADEAKRLADMDYRTIGCPAMIRSNGTSPIGKLWERMVWICEQTMWRQTAEQRSQRDPLATPRGFVKAKLPEGFDI